MTARASTPASRATGPIVLRVIWIAIGLGIAMQFCVLLGATAMGASSPKTAQLAADTVQKTSWSVLVCAALAFGAAISRGSVAVTGLAGLLGAPAAFVIARALQKGVNQALTQGVAAQAAATPATTIAILKGLEYGALGAAIAWLVPRYGTTLRLHLLCGLIAGLVFGGATLAILSPMPAGVFVPRAINETLFPIGCALALWLGRTFISHKQTVEIST